MGLITDLFIQEDKCLVIWMCDGLMIRKPYLHPVVAVFFGDNRKILIVEPDSSKSPNNAVIYNGDGSEYIRIINPYENQGAICFSDAYEVKGKLNLFFMCKNAYYGCLVDEFGTVSNIYETR
jgi:hypothetical protein